MSDEIIFLGTAGDPIVVGSQSRSSGGFILKSGKVQFHVDPGPGSLVQAKRFGINPRETTAVITTHAHLSHCGDMNAVVSAMTHGGLDRRGVVAGQEDTIKPPVLWEYYQKCVERILPLQVGKNVGIEHVDIHATPTKHSSPGIGLKFHFPEYVLGYLSDTTYYKGLADEYLDADIIILNVVEPSGHDNDQNMTTDSAIKFLNIAKPTLAVITHFGTKMISADPIYEARKIQLATKVQCLAAKDGMVLEPETLLL